MPPYGYWNFPADGTLRLAGAAVKYVTARNVQEGAQIDSANPRAGRPRDSRQDAGATSGLKTDD
jgi:hypothetical protein